VTVTTIAILLAYIVVAASGKFSCTGTHTESSFNSIIVPQGETCTLEKFNEVSGDITVQQGASLIICPDNDIAGNIKAKGADTVFISDQKIPPCALPPPPKALGITIGGSVKVKNANSFSLIGNPAGVTSIGKDVKVKDTQDVNIIDFDGIAGNVKAEKNGDVTITGNTIGKNLKIKGTTGSCVDADNSVGGKIKGCP
jgi:hypothetical protein|tara:strand:+ start:21955 stop:22548 length:594 start_codon:yes stop_codon:yes gene_type:complete